MLDGREIEHIVCSCGGAVKKVKPTDQEEKDYGCGRTECCVKAFKCGKCETRWMFSLASPEMDTE